MFLSTSGNSADTSLPKVMDMMVFWMASFLSWSQHVKSLWGSGGCALTVRMHIEIWRQQLALDAHKTLSDLTLSLP